MSFRIFILVSDMMIKYLVSGRMRIRLLTMMHNSDALPESRHRYEEAMCSYSSLGADVFVIQV